MAHDETGQSSRMKQANLEQELVERLTIGEMEQLDKGKQAAARLSPKYEIRMQSTYEPVAEGTRLYRSMAREIDSRYDKYVEKEVSPPRDQTPSE